MVHIGSVVTVPSPIRSYVTGTHPRVARANRQELTVEDMREIRRQLRAAGGDLHELLRRAAACLETEDDHAAVKAYYARLEDSNILSEARRQEVQRAIKVAAEEHNSHPSLSEMLRQSSRPAQDRFRAVDWEILVASDYLARSGSIISVTGVIREVVGERWLTEGTKLGNSIEAVVSRAFGRLRRGAGGTCPQCDALILPKMVSKRRRGNSRIGRPRREVDQQSATSLRFTGQLSFASDLL
jgi:hypothetical protein